MTFNAVRLGPVAFLAALEIGIFYHTVALHAPVAPLSVFRNNPGLSPERRLVAGLAFSRPG